MSDIVFPTGTTDGTPATDDRILFSDTSASNATKDCAISALPISDATQTAIDLKADKATTINGYDLSANRTLTQDDIGDGTTNKQFSATEKTKLAGIETGATANSSDATLLARANHTGTQTASTISDFDTEVSNNTDVSANTAARHDAVTVSDSSNIDLTLTGQQISADLIDTAVTPGSYTLSAVTVDQKGRITAISNGSLGGTPLTTKGDLLTYDTGDARLGVGTDGQVLTADSTQVTGIKWSTPAGGGDVVGPASATDNAVARFDSTTGKLIQNSAVTIADTTGDITGGKYNTVAISGSATPTLAVTGTTAVSGTNTGDQTSIVGITGTKAEFNTAMTDADFATLAGTETLTNKTLTSPQVGTINDTSSAGGNPALQLSGGATKVNYAKITTGATGTGVTVEAIGSDTDIDLLLVSKGAGKVKYNGTEVLKIDGDGSSLTGITGTQITMDRISGSTYSTAQDMQDIFHSAGWSSGGAITDDGGTSFSVAGGTGFIRTSDSQVANLQFFDWLASNTNAIALGETWYVGVDYNAGTPIVSIQSTYNWNFNTTFPIGAVTRDASGIHISNGKIAVGDHAGKMIQRILKVNGIQRNNRDGGLIVGETGTRNITLSAGGLEDALNTHTISAIDTSVTGTFDKYLGATFDAAATQWDNTNYNNGGVKTALAANKWANAWIYLETDGDLVYVYGTAEYNTQALAEAASAPSTIPIRVTLGGLLVARLTFQNGASTATIRSAFTTTFSGTAATSHSNLSNLAWTSSGHTGTATRVAGFDGSGVASEYTMSGTGTELALTTSPTFVTPALGTPSSGTLTNATGLPVAGVVGDTTTALGVGSLELGHASDTTLTRVSAGVVAIEGVNIVKAGAITTNGITMSTARLLGRSTAATGAVEEITLGTNLSFTGTTLNATGGGAAIETSVAQIRSLI